MNLDDIQPFRSVGDLTLGWPESKVIGALGDDYVREVDEYGDLSIEFEDRGILCTFWESDDFRLGWISVERPTALLYGQSLFGQPKAVIEQFVSSMLQTVVAETDGVTHEDGHVQEWIDVDTHGLTFWFRDDALYLIDVTCEWSDNDTPNWPTD